MEVYVDDMLVKSQQVDDHVHDLEEMFQILEELDEAESAQMHI